MNPATRLLHLGLAALFAVGTARAETPSAEPYEKDAAFLSGKVAQYRYRLKNSPEGAQQLAKMEAALARLKGAVAAIKEAAGEIESADSHLKYLKDMELEPKEQEVARVRRAIEDQWEKFGQRLTNLERRIKVHNDTPHQFSDKQQAALAAYNSEKYALDAERSALDREREQLNEQLQGMFDAAVKAYTKAQQEFSETSTKREQAAQRFQAQNETYTETRGPVVDALVALDNEPPPAVTGHLTPFPTGGVPTKEAGTVDVIKPPVGPGGNPHAIDELRVVTFSSRVGAGLDDHDQPVNPPSEPVAKTSTGYVFDTGGGLGVADLPEVDTPPGKAVDPVPLVVEPEPPAAKVSPVLQKFVQQQADGFAKLDQLYHERADLKQQGAQASPEAWTKLVQAISTTQAEVNTAAVAQKLASGSQVIDLTITKKKQKPISDLTLPPPPPPSEKP